MRVLHRHNQKFEIIRFSVLLFFFLVLVIPINAYSYILTEEDKSQVLSGNIVIKEAENKDGVPGLVAAFSVNANLKDIWSVFVDYENFTKVFSNVKRLKVLEQDEEGAVVEFWVNAVVSDLNYVLYRKYDIPYRKLTWVRKSGDLKLIEGSWEIVDIPNENKKMVIYRSFVEIGIFVPTKLLRWGAMREAEQMCLSVKNRVENP